MASFIFNIWKGGLAAGTYNWDDDGGVTGKTVKVALSEIVMVKADEEDADDLADLTPGWEFDGSYARTAVTSLTVKADTDTSNRAELDAADTTVLAVGADAGGQTCAGVLLYIDMAGVTDASGDATAIPIAFFDITAFYGNGSDILLAWNSVGLITLT